MQIPLDYYRILGLPTQSTPEQLQQAHRDRVLQLPRREYSEIAIASRRELLDEAYTTLSDPALRSAYHVNTTRSPATGESGVPTGIGLLTVADHQVIGALLLLQELGEYELVLQVGIPLLPKKNFHPDTSGESEIVHADIALTLALAYLELGREYWQQGHYESAAESLEAGQSLLLREGLFAGVRGEIKSDLYKLRPYRVLELLALEHVSDRRKGIQILRDMLQERGGIDGTGDDFSGLTIDDFLRFIQQLRDYLTTEEQQALFEAEARRPSAVATYLAVYALLARGFALCEPELIRRVKPLLVRLAKRQDVHLEQAITALLLGQTEQASRALELSREYEAIVFIRDHSQGSPDLLPGLCLYTEQWLRQDVFPHFRDLVNCKVTLKDYFANPQVQRYLEELPQEAADRPDEWEVVSMSPLQSPREQRASNPPSSNVIPLDPNRTLSAGGEGQAFENRVFDRPALLSAGNSSRPNPAPISRRPTSPHAALQTTSPQRSRRRSSRLEHPVPEARHASSRHPGSSKPQFGPLAIVVGAALLFLASLWFVGVNVAKWINQSNSSTSTAQGDTNLDIRLDQPILTLSSAAPSPIPNAVSSSLTKEAAQQLVNQWLQAKSDAMGSKHELTPLTTILTGEALLHYQQQAESAKREGFYALYEHTVTNVESVEVKTTNPSFTPEPFASSTLVSEPTPPPSSSVAPIPSPTPGSEVPNKAIVVAVVNESATFYQNGQVDQASSYNNPALRVEYTFEPVNGEWRIAAITPLP